MPSNFWPLGYQGALSFIENGIIHFFPLFCPANLVEGEVFCFPILQVGLSALCFSVLRFAVWSFLTLPQHRKRHRELKHLIPRQKTNRISEGLCKIKGNLNTHTSAHTSTRSPRYYILRGLEVKLMDQIKGSPGIGQSCGGVPSAPNLYLQA